MKYKGRNFRRSNSVVMLPMGESNYVQFGYAVRPGVKIPKKAVETRCKWPETGDTVYAVPVELTGHSLTNMAYGKDGRVYLAYDGCVFIGR